MKSLELVRTANQSILKNRMRALLTTLGVVIGVSAVIVMVSIGAGARQQIEERVRSLGTNLIVVTSGAVMLSGVSQGAQTMGGLTLDDAQALKAESFRLAAVSPVVLSRQQIIGGVGNWPAMTLGVASEYQEIRNWPVASGAFFDAGDVTGTRTVAVIGSTVARTLFPDGDAVGSPIRIGNVPFDVIGVLAPKGQTAEGADQDDVVLAPYTTVHHRLSGRMFISQIIASTSSPEDIPVAQAEARSILRASHRLGPNEPDDFEVRNQDELASAARGTTDVMTLLLSAIASISLLVGGIGIMNIMLVSVTERTREIGLRMAVGARGSDVLTQFLVESAVLSVAGGVLGVAVGFAASQGLGAVTGWSTHVGFPVVAVALGCSAAVGVFFGFYPARRAALLEPVDALRYE